MCPPPPFQIKICGITRPIDAVNAVLAGADAIGLNFYSGSQRFVDYEQAGKIVDAVDANCRENGFQRPLVVGVFVNSSAAEISEAIAKCDLDAVQFHGHESTSILNQLLPSQQKNNRLTTVRVIRVPAPELANLPTKNLETSHQSELAKMIDETLRWQDAGVDAILLDAAAPNVFGGSGMAIDWSLVRKFDVDLPLILAGGLNPQNVGTAIKESGVQAVDVASGVETAPGIKDEQLMRQFVQRCGLRR